MSVVPPVPYRHPVLVGNASLMASPWTQFLEALRVRVGGADAATLDAVTDTVTDTVADVETVTDLVTQAHSLYAPLPLPPAPHPLIPDPAPFSALWASMHRDVEALERSMLFQGLPATLHARFGNLDPIHDLWAATGIGFSGTVTDTAYYLRVWPLAVLYLPQLSGTSNANTFTVTGLPAGVQPTRTQWLTARVTNNAINTSGLVRLNAGSAVLDVYPDQSAGTFTPSGTKTLFATTLVYLLL